MAQKIGINCGSGQRPFKSTLEIQWYNVDSQGRWNPDITGDCSDLSRIFGDNSVDYVVLHHVLEHFGCGEGAGLINEAHRVLKRGGSLLVYVPDMRSLAEGWLSHKIPTQIYMTNIYGAYMGSEDDRHKWGFTQQSLFEFLRQWTWFTVQEPFSKLSGADVAHDWWILEMECVK